MDLNIWESALFGNTEDLSERMIIIRVMCTCIANKSSYSYSYTETDTDTDTVYRCRYISIQLRLKISNIQSQFRALPKGGTPLN